VCELRKHVQQVDAYLGAYGVEHKASRLRFRLDPQTHIDHPTWPDARDISSTVELLKVYGEKVVSAFNHLSMTDQYLVKLPELAK
jgi:hypothetical protein